VPRSPFWKPVIFTIGLTPFLLFTGILSAGAGEGSYFFAKLLFPYTLFSTIAFQVITPAFILLAVLQFPLYGLVAGILNSRGKLGLALLLLACAHSIAVVSCFVLIGENFS
jgi:hypothetical protein